MTPSAQNNNLTPISTTPPVKSTDPFLKNAHASSNSEDKTEHTPGNVDDSQTTVNANAKIQDKLQNNHKEKAKSVVIIGDSKLSM